jgi:hypothetical protein
MTRLAVLLATSLLFAIPAASTSAAPSASQVAPIVLNGQNGTLDVSVYLGPSADVASIPMMGTVSLKVCASTDCETYSTNYMSGPESYSSHRWLSAQVLIALRFNKSAVTVQVPKDIVDPTKGWSEPSNAVTGWTDPAAWFQTQTGRPTLQVLFGSLDSTSMTKADLCANYNPSKTYTSSISAYQQLDITGYTSAKYDLYYKGAIERTVDLSSSLTSNTGTSFAIPACGANAFSPFSMTGIQNLAAGRAYKLVYTITGAGKPDLGATLDFVTPGGCPSGDVSNSSPPRATSYGVTDENGVLFSYLALGLATWRLESVLGKRLAPIYNSPSKVGPYNGKLLNIKTSTEKWKYISSLDDWAKVIDNAESMTSKTVLGNTVFADCTATQVKTTLSIDETTTPAASQACVIEANVVKPAAIGPCYVKATVDNASVSASGVRRFSTPATVQMNYSFTSISAATTTSTTSTTLASTPVTYATTPTVKAAPTVKVARTLSGKTIASYAKLSVASTSKVSLRVVTSSAKICRVVGTSLKGLKAGTCKVTVSVKPKKGSTKSKTVSVKVTK